MTSPLQKLQEALLLEEGDHPGLTERAREFLLTKPIRAVAVSFGLGLSVAAGVDAVRYQDLEAMAQEVKAGQMAQTMVDVDDESAPAPDGRLPALPSSLQVTLAPAKSNAPSLEQQEKNMNEALKEARRYAKLSSKGPGY